MMIKMAGGVRPTRIVACIVANQLAIRLYVRPQAKVADQSYHHPSIQPQQLSFLFYFFHRVSRAGQVFIPLQLVATTLHVCRRDAAAIDPGLWSSKAR